MCYDRVCVLLADRTSLQDLLHRQGTHRQRYVSPLRHRDAQLTRNEAIAQALQTKVFCDSRKAAILRCQADPELHALLTKDPLEGGVHLVPLGVIASDRLKEYVERFKGHYSKAVGFRPTGWTYVPRPSLPNPSRTDATRRTDLPRQRGATCSRPCRRSSPARRAARSRTRS